MGREGDPAHSGIFVRFKHHVDSHVASGFHALLGLASPSPPRQPDTYESSWTPLGSDLPPQHPSSSSRTMESRDTQRPRWSWDVFSLISSPAYSPPALRHLPPPVPNDLTPGMDATVFTFEDAFEDLLAVSQGQSLLEIDTRYQQRRLLRQMFPTGEPTWFWKRRLESQRLVQAPSWGPTLLSDWDNRHRATDWSGLWRAAASEESPEPSHGDFVHEQQQQGRPEREFHGDGSRHELPGSQERQVRRPAPDTFDDLFSSLSSTFTESQKSWDAFLNAIMTHAAADEKRQPPQSASKTKQVETRDEYVDRAGYLHSTVTRRTLDEQGHEIGRETYVTLRPADDLDDDDMDAVECNQASPGKKAGWFWK